MKRLCVSLIAVALLASVAHAGVSYVSNFNIESAEMNVYGFSIGGFPTAGPDYVDVSNIVGTYQLDIPPAGSGLYDVYIECSGNVDYDQNGVWDDPFVLAPTYVGRYNSPGPSTAWGPGTLPLPLTFDPGTGSVTLNLTLDYDIDLDNPYPAGYPIGSFGSNAHANFVISGDPADMLALNAYLTYQDNLEGGGDGIFDWDISGEFTVTAVPVVPEPLTLMLFAGSVGVGLLRKRLK